MAEASFTMDDTIGIICVTISTKSPMMTTMVSTAKSQSGADFPLIFILLSSFITGRPISETTKAAMI